MTVSSTADQPIRALTPAEVAARLADGDTCYSAHATGGVTTCPPPGIAFPGGPNLNRSAIEGWVEHWAKRGVTFWPTEDAATAHIES